MNINKQVRNYHIAAWEVVGKLWGGKVLGARLIKGRPPALGRNNTAHFTRDERHAYCTQRAPVLKHKTAQCYARVKLDPKVEHCLGQTL